MSLRINDVAPDFTAESTEGTINFHQWIGDGWAVLFSHPKDFTPVCTTELGYMARIKPEFDKRNTKILGISVDGVSNHQKWSKDIETSQGHAVNYPLIGDPQLNVVKIYDMLPQMRVTPARDARRRTTPRRARVHHRPRQEDQGDADVSDEHRPQLRRDSAAARLVPADGVEEGGDAGELEAGRGRDHPAGRCQTTMRRRRTRMGGSRRCRTFASCPQPR
jgi:peroxiredoxin